MVFRLEHSVVGNEKAYGNSIEDNKYSKGYHGSMEWNIPNLNSMECGLQMCRTLGCNFSSHRQRFNLYLWHIWDTPLNQVLIPTRTSSGFVDFVAGYPWCVCFLGVTTCSLYVVPLFSKPILNALALTFDSNRFYSLCTYSHGAHWYILT